MLKIKTWLVIIASSLLLGCSNMKLEQYEGTEPAFDLFTYFEGKTYAWGQFQSRSGEVKRRFYVDITGTIQGDTITLDEQFIYDDGETEQRIWVIQRITPNTYRGTAGDVIGEARGRTVGSVFHWTYTLDLPFRNSTIAVNFDDWMYLQSEEVMLNRATVTKFGFKVGEVTLFFNKQGPSS